MSDWYYARDNQQRGPIAFESLQALAAQGQLTAADLVWTEGMAQWTAAAQVSGLIPAPIAPPAYQAPAFAGQYVPAGMAPMTPLVPMPIGYQPVPAPSQHASLALVGMILSLVSIIMGPLLAIPGAICGWIALKGMRQTGNLENRGFALAALWVGIGVTAVFALVMLLFFGLIAVRMHHP